MLFRENREDERRVWVDRGIDSRLDDFTICDPCNETLRASDPEGLRWHDGEELCPKCLADFEARRLAVDLFGLPRPLNGMLEDRVLTNDEAAADPAPPVLGALEYFRHRGGQPSVAASGEPSEPGDGDALAPGPNGPFPPDPNDGFQPGPYDAFRPGPYDGFLPGPYDGFGPGPYDGFLPGPYDGFRPGPYDGFLPGPYDGFRPGPYDDFLPGLYGGFWLDRQDDLQPE